MELLINTHSNSSFLKENAVIYVAHSLACSVILLLVQNLTRNALTWGLLWKKSQTRGPSSSHESASSFNIAKALNVLFAWNKKKDKQCLTTHSSHLCLTESIPAESFLFARSQSRHVSTPHLHISANPWRNSSHCNTANPYGDKCKWAYLPLNIDL